MLHIKDEYLLTRFSGLKGSGSHFPAINFLSIITERKIE